jgi:hypothetical protein
MVEAEAVREMRELAGRGWGAKRIARGLGLGRKHGAPIPAGLPRGVRLSRRVLAGELFAGHGALPPAADVAAR